MNIKITCCKNSVAVSFADQIKQERERLGITQAQAASLLSVSKSVLSKWETADRTPIAITQEGVLARLQATNKKP
jgi:DNA-binding transcriptional regulator YiaG